MIAGYDRTSGDGVTTIGGIYDLVVYGDDETHERHQEMEVGNITWHNLGLPLAETKSLAKLGFEALEKDKRKRFSDANLEDLIDVYATKAGITVDPSDALADLDTDTELEDGSPSYQVMMLGAFLGIAQRLLRQYRLERCPMELTRQVKGNSGAISDTALEGVWNGSLIDPVSFRPVAGSDFDQSEYDKTQAEAVSKYAGPCIAASVSHMGKQSELDGSPLEKDDFHVYALNLIPGPRVMLRDNYIERHHGTTSKIWLDRIARNLTFSINSKRLDLGKELIQTVTDRRAVKRDEHGVLPIPERVAEMLPKDFDLNQRVFTASSPTDKVEVSVKGGNSLIQFEGTNTVYKFNTEVFGIRMTLAYEARMQRAREKEEEKRRREREREMAERKRDPAYYRFEDAMVWELLWGDHNHSESVLEALERQGYSFRNNGNCWDVSVGDRNFITTLRELPHRLPRPLEDTIRSNEKKFSDWLTTEKRKDQPKRRETKIAERSNNLKKRRAEKISKDEIKPLAETGSRQAGDSFSL